MLSSYENYIDAQDGADLTLTIDSSIQSLAEQLLQEGIEAYDVQNGGFVIAMNPQTGAIYAMASSPDYDPNDYNAIIEALRTGSADMAYMGSQALALGVERTDLEPIVMKAEDGDPNKAIYHSVFITNSANDDINSIEDIKGRTMAFVDPDSTSGNLVPTAEIIQAFPDDNLNSDMLHTNGDFFEAVSFSGSHQAGLQAVVKGDVDVAPISDQILASEIANGNANESDVKIIHESGAIPAEAMVVAEHVDQETRDMLTEFLTSYDNEQYFTDVIKVPGARFIQCDMSDYQEIIELNKIINEF